MKAKTGAVLFVLLVVALLGWWSIQVTRHGFVNRRTTTSNPLMTTATLDSALALISPKVPTVWVEMSGTLQPSPVKGWAWLLLTDDTRALPVRLGDTSADRVCSQSITLRGMVEPVTEKVASELPNPPSGQVVAAIVLREGVTPPSWFGVWGRIVGGVVLTVFLGLVFLGNVLRLFGFAAKSDSADAAQTRDTISGGAVAGIQHNLGSGTLHSGGIAQRAPPFSLADPTGILDVDIQALAKMTPAEFKAYLACNPKLKALADSALSEYSYSSSAPQSHSRSECRTPR